MVRALLVGKVLTEEERAKWNDRDGKVVHRPSFHGWHYANSVYVLYKGERTKIGYFCAVCNLGMLFEDWRTDA